MAEIYNDCVETYNMALLWDDSIELYAMPAPVCNDSVESYRHAISVISDFIEKHSILNHTPVLSDSVERYILVDQDTEIINHTVLVTVSGAPVEFKDFSVSCDEGSYCFAFTGAPANYAAYLQCVEEAELIATINGDSFIFEIDSRSTNRTSLSASYTVSARSKTKRLDFPYCDPVITSNSATTAAVFVSEMAARQNINAIFEALDFPVAANMLTMNEQSILSGIKKIADAIGGVIQSSKTGDILVRYEYPISPTCYADTGPAMVISDIDDILTIEESSESQKGYDNIIVSDQAIIDAPENYIIIELDDTRNKGKTTFSKIDKVIYLKVFSNQPYTLEVTGGSAKKIKTDEIQSENEIEMVAFVRLENPTTSKPVHELKSTTWFGANLGALSLVANSYNKIAAENATESAIGIAEIAYNTRYDVWAVYPPSYSTDNYAIMALSEQQAVAI